MAVTYIIEHVGSGKFYVGSTGKPHLRFDRHWRALRSGAHHCIRLQRLWNRCAGEGFKIKVLRRDSLERCRALEGRYLSSSKIRNRLLNSSLSIAYGDTTGNHPEKQKIIAKRSAAARAVNAKLSPEERAAMHRRPGAQNGMYGKKHSRKSLAMMSRANKGNSYAAGSVRSAETRARLSKVAQERVGKLNGFFGKHHSAETKERIRQKKIGHRPTNLRPVKVGKQRFDSVADAARYLNVVSATVLYRIKARSAKYASYRYLDE